MNLERVVVVEPHADDAYLSLHATMEHFISCKIPVTIVTVFGNLRRFRESADYAEKIGAQWATLGNEESGAGLRTATPTATVSEAALKTQFMQWAAANRLGSIEARVLLPLGLQHHEHQLVRSALDQVVPIHRRAYYVEVPYCLTQKNAPDVYLSTVEKRVWFLKYPSAAKKGAFNTIFKSQSAFFYYNPPEKYGRTAELVLEA